MLHMLIRNRAALNAIWDALAQYVQNTEDVEDDLTAKGRDELNEARKLLEWVDLLFIEGRQIRERRRS